LKNMNYWKRVNILSYLAIEALLRELEQQALKYYKMVKLAYFSVVILY